MFKQAVKHEAKLRLAIAGPSGSGKTYSALTIATGLGDRIAVVDTEHGSASKYADLFQFDVLEMDAPFHPNRFCEAIQGAEQSGYDVLIIDSLSHAWNGPGGLLELVDQFAKRMKSANTFAAWKDATPIQNALIEAIVSAKIHIITTMRSKQEYVIEKVERNGRSINVPKKLGMAPVQRDSMEYEFDVYLDMDIENNAIVQKTRCPELTGQVIHKPDGKLAATLREWLHGKPPEPNGHTPKVAEPGTWPHVVEGSATNGKVADARAKLEENGRATLGTVASLAAATGMYSNEHHALQAIKQYDFPDGVQVIMGQKVTKEGALKVYDWLIERKIDDDGYEPPF